MSKEPTQRDVEQTMPVEGWKHGLSPEQIKLIQDAYGEPDILTPQAKREGHSTADPDELEEEIEKAEEEGEFKSMHGKTKNAKTKR